MTMVNSGLKGLRCVKNCTIPGYLKITHMIDMCLLCLGSLTTRLVQYKQRVIIVFCPFSRFFLGSLQMCALERTVQNNTS